MPFGGGAKNQGQEKKYEEAEERRGRRGDEGS